MTRCYRPHDNLGILATLKGRADTVEKTVVGTIVESLILDSQDEAEYSTPPGDLLHILLSSRWPASPSLKRATA